MRSVASIAALITLALAGGLAALWPAPPETAIHAAATGKSDRLRPAPLVTGSIDSDEPSADGATDPDTRAITAILAALDSGSVATARQARDALARGTDAHALATWLIAMSGKRDVPAGDYRRALDQLDGWPGMETVRAHYERRLADGWFAGPALSAAIGDGPPQTVEAASVLAASAKSAGKAEDARALLIPFWHSHVLDSATEAQILSGFGDVLTQDDHRIRYFNMMVRERIRAAERLVGPAAMTGLHEAWAAAIRGQRDADALIAAVPEALLETEAGLFMRVERLRKTDRAPEAAELLAEVPDASANPDAWWVERRIVSRLMREAGDPGAALDIAAAQTRGSVETRAEAAFHAGWYALRGLDDGERALAHFREMERIVTGPPSRARAAYWTGRALERLGNREGAQAAYRSAALHPTTFHGQLAASAIGLKQLEIPAVTADADGVLALGNEPVFRAIALLARAGGTERAAALYYGLADRLTRPEAVAALVDHARIHADRRLALRIAKRAAWNGVETGQLAFPGDAIDGLDALPAQKRMLALAVARQESEFNPAAVSRADARGLLQLLPSTAQAVARRLDVPYSPDRLTSDPAFNALLGTTYLGEQIERFDRSLVLTFVAYNAGPGRAREWIARYGSPVGLPLHDAIDWIEQIPFPETQGYVMKVLENLTVYKAQAGLPLTIETDITGR